MWARTSYVTIALLLSTAPLASAQSYGQLAKNVMQACGVWFSGPDIPLKIEGFTAVEEEPIFGPNYTSTSYVSPHADHVWSTTAEGNDVVMKLDCGVTNIPPDLIDTHPELLGDTARFMATFAHAAAVITEMRAVLDELIEPDMDASGAAQFYDFHYTACLGGRRALVQLHSLAGYETYWVLNVSTNSITGGVCGAAS